jgi:hypothetical protein
MRITALLPALVVFSLPFPAQGFHGIPLWKVITGQVRRGSTAPPPPLDPNSDREFTPKFCYQCRHYSPPNIRDSGPDFGRCLRDNQNSDIDMRISLFRVTGTVPVFNTSMSIVW